MLTPYDWVYGIATITAAFLSIIAGFLALTMFEHAHQRKHLGAWKPLIFALVLFTIEEILGTLKAFGIYSNPWITHVIPSFILAFLIGALIKQINITRGYAE